MIWCPCVSVNILMCQICARQPRGGSSDDDSATGCSTVTLLPTCLHTFGKQSIKQGRGRGVQGNQVEQGHHMRSLIPSTWGCFQVWRKLNISSMCHLYRVSFVTDATPRSSQPPLTLNDPYSSHTTSSLIMQPSFGHVISPRQQLTTKSSTSTPKLTSSIYLIRIG